MSANPYEKTFDKERISINLARLRLHGQVLEIVVDPDLAVDYVTALKARNQRDLPEVGEPDLREVLKSEEIFHDAHKGELASENFLKEVFNTTEPLKVAEKILLDGEIQLTAEHRKRIVDAKKKKIVDIIHRNAIDPTTNLPHPVSRIERMLEEVHFRVDEYKKAENQVDEAVHLLKPIIPIKFDVKKIRVTLLSEIANKVYGNLVRDRNKILRESWNDDGSLTMEFEVPAGLKVEFVEKINDLTSGGAEIEILEDQ